MIIIIDRFLPGINDSKDIIVRILLSSQFNNRIVNEAQENVYAYRKIIIFLWNIGNNANYEFQLGT